MFILDKLWRGEISPSQKYIQSGSQFEKLLDRLCQKEDLLRSSISPDLKNVFFDYQKIGAEMQDIENRETFYEGFRMGAQLMLDIFSENQNTLRNISEE